MHSSNIYTIATGHFRGVNPHQDHCPGAAPHNLWATALGATCCTMINNNTILGFLLYDKPEVQILSVPGPFTIETSTTVITGNLGDNCAEKYHSPATIDQDEFIKDVYRSLLVWSTDNPYLYPDSNQKTNDKDPDHKIALLP